CGRGNVVVNAAQIAQEMHAVRTDIAGADSSTAGEFVLNVKAPLLHVRILAAQRIVIDSLAEKLLIALDTGSGIRQGNGWGAGAQLEGGPHSCEVAIIPAVDRSRSWLPAPSLIDFQCAAVNEPKASPDNRFAIGKGRPCKGEPGRKVVLVNRH